MWLRGAELTRRFSLLLLVFACNGCLYARIVYHNTPDLTAPSMFDSRIVKASPAPRPLLRGARQARPALTDAERVRYQSFDRLLSANETHSFLMLKDDVIVYERYFHGASADSVLPGFSMSKTYAAVLVGRALQMGLLGSMSDKIGDYVPPLAHKRGYRDVTLDQLLRMTSGIEFDEETVESAKLYYSTDLRDLMYSYEVTHRPGERYLYGSVNVQLLWDALHRRLGGSSVSAYFERELWAPLGATHAASWSLDSEASGIEKFFGGFNATTLDHARLGLLFLHRGELNGQRLLPESWIERSLTPDPIAGWVDTSDGRLRRGEYQWFLTADGRDYFAKGYHGQYVFVVPSERTVIVRFGEGYGDVDWTGLFQRIARGS